MSDLLLPQHDAPPWMPADNVAPLQVFNEYNIPLAGLIEQDGMTYLYVCLLGELEDANICAYARLSEGEVTWLSSLIEDELATAISETLANRVLVVAIASDYKLADWLSIDVGVEGPAAVVRRFIAQLSRHLEATRRDLEELQSQQEQPAGC